MLDLITILLCVVIGLGYRKIVNDQEKNRPGKLRGMGGEINKIPETENVPALEINEMRADTFVQAGRRHQQGTFAVRDSNNVSA